MPVRIYDISKKLGLENKEVLTKAKELGIAAAKVASSSLDKITAEYLEQQLILVHPDRAAAAPATAPVVHQPSEPIVFVMPEPAAETAMQEPETQTATALLEPEPPVSEPPPAVEQPAPPVHFISPPPAPVEPDPPKAPPAP